MELAVEIGPGRGALTEHLLGRAKRVIAIEIDAQLATELRERWAGNSRLEIVEADAASIDPGQWGGGVLAGNLPYYVATTIISRYLRRPALLRQGTFLIQEEVADRITAQPGTREYGYFSVECQFLGAPEYLFHVPPGAFQPPPKVDSAVVRIRPRAREQAAEGPDRFLKFVSACFRQKRKTLRNNLSALYPRELLDGYPGLARRAEQLTVQELRDLYQTIARPLDRNATIASAAEPGSGTVEARDEPG